MVANLSTALSRSQAHSVNRSLLLALLLLAGNSLAAPLGDDPLRIPDERQLVMARELAAKMAANQRGPYTRIRWFCNDGTVLPPAPYACRPHGGGRQHAEYSPDRTALAQLGFRVGTVFAALTWEEFYDAGGYHDRLRELALERYLVEVADGWVLKRARHYRGRVQIEDEEAAGRRLLLRLLADTEWLRRHFLLARETVRVVPHSGGDDLTRDVRRRAQDLAELNSDFEKLRVEVHTSPSSNTAGKVRIWARQLRAISPDSDQVRLAEQLADSLDELYGVRGRQRRLVETRAALTRAQATEKLAGLLQALPEQSPVAQVQRLASTLVGLREVIEADNDPALRLRLFDLMADLEAELRQVVVGALQASEPTRRMLLALCRNLVLASYGSGLLSRTEMDYTRSQLEGAMSQGEIDPLTYLETSRAVNRAVGWPVATVRYEFAAPLVRYSALDTRATGFVDDLLRGSPVLALAQAARLLAFDAQEAAGIQRRLAGRPAPALMALNPGIARGRLRILTDADLAAGVTPAREDIVVVPQTIAELSPVAGILTGGEGNLLSHLQLLARNLGIPNVAVSAALFADIEKLAGKEVVLAVDSAGSVILEPTERLSESVLASLSESRGVFEAGSLEVPEPVLEFTSPIPLKHLDRSLSGRTVGPKAANLGELARMFPGRVAPAVALPFGLFNEHMKLATPSLRERLANTYRAREDGELDQNGLHRELEAIRAEILALTLTPQAREEILAAMRLEFGEDDSYGVFIRSDTNVEDLPGFSGAGLNETLPHIVGRDRQLAGIPQVWASVLSPRSIAWRANLMKNPERIYASVLLMKSVPADKSGVLVSSDLVSYGPGITVSTAWGVGGAVAGEAAETLVLLADGEERLISESKTPFRRNLANHGGVVWEPAYAGPVLTEDEKRQLRALVAEVARKYDPVLDSEQRPMPWDIEFGFIKGELTLFQIRPLVEKGYRRAARFTRLLAGATPTVTAGLLALDEAARLP